jgi:ABC-type nitrate/sulfonate/bicarbonate transport system substrate-binding protein
MGRKKQEPVNRAAELREQAKDLAGQSGEALKEFAETTGSAAKDFASRARDAAKELVDSIEKAAKHVDEPEEKRRGGRKVLRTLLVLGVGGAVLANERARNAIGSALRRSRSGDEPEIWRPEPSPVNGEVREPEPSA